MPPNITIIVLTYNSVRTVEATLRGLLEQEHAEPFDLIVIDDGSTDGTQKICKSLGVRVIQNDRIGLAGSLNRGIAVSQGDFIITVHGDAVPLSPTWLSQLLDPVKNGDAGASCSLQHSPNVENNELTLWERFLWGKLSPHHALNNKADAYRKKALLDVGLFDNWRFRTAGEDEDMSLRLRRKGWKVVGTTAQAQHNHKFPDATSGAILVGIMKKEYTYGRAGGALRRKFPAHKPGAYVYPIPKSPFSDGLFRAALCVGSVTPLSQLICIPALAYAGSTGTRTLLGRTRFGLLTFFYPFFNIARYWCYTLGFLHGLGTGRQI